MKNHLSTHVGKTVLLQFPISFNVVFETFGFVKLRKECLKALFQQEVLSGASAAWRFRALMFVVGIKHFIADLGRICLFPSRFAGRLLAYSSFCELAIRMFTVSFKVWLISLMMTNIKVKFRLKAP